MSRLRVLLVQLGSTGDCLLVTPIAKQIKEIDYPGCHLTWLIGSRCKQVLKNNPFVDEIVEIPLNEKEDLNKKRNLIDEYVNNIGRNNFDNIFITDYTKVNYKNWYGTTRSSLFRSYSHPVEINPQPLIYLDEKEIKNVAIFCEMNNINENTFNVLFECSPLSGQSLMTIENAKDISERLVLLNKNIKFILSSNHSYSSDNPNIIDGSGVSFRENAELSNYCHLVVGCNSGISWLCTSNHSKKIPFIQVINPHYKGGNCSASFKNDFRYFGIDTKILIELHNPVDNILEKCILAASENRFEKARKKYDVTDNSVFSDFRFLKESRIKPFEKVSLFVYYVLREFIIKTYKKIKPKWFTLKVWVNKFNQLF